MAKNSEQVVTAAELEKFDHFLFEMDDVLLPFIANAEAAGCSPDYSFESLDVLENFVLSNSADREDSQFQNRAARYLGEVFRKNVGGKWVLCVKDPKYLFFKLPVITGYSRMPIDFCPIEVINNFMRKKELGLLRRAVESHLEFKS